MATLNGTIPLHLEEASAYGYIPTQSIAILFIVLFSITTLVHTGQSLFYRMWWLLPTATLCGLMEILGWAARCWSSISPDLETPYTIQITTTILAPTPLIAANFVILGRIILALGPAYSRLSPKWYAIIFCTCDVVSLFVQAAGGGIASSAASGDGDPTTGGNIMLAGIIFQMTTITIYVLCAIEFFIRYIKHHPVRNVPLPDADGKSIRGFMDQRLRIMSVALMFSTTCLFIRAVYRTIELAGGWNGRIIKTQVYFNVLDAAMVILAMYTLNLAHPGLLIHGGTITDEKHATSGITSRNTNSLSSLA